MAGGRSKRRCAWVDYRNQGCPMPASGRQKYCERHRDRTVGPPPSMNPTPATNTRYGAPSATWTPAPRPDTPEPGPSPPSRRRQASRRKPRKSDPNADDLRRIKNLLAARDKHPDEWDDSIEGERIRELRARIAARKR